MVLEEEEKLRTASYEVKMPCMDFPSGSALSGFGNQSAVTKDGWEGTSHSFDLAKLR